MENVLFLPEKKYFDSTKVTLLKLHSYSEYLIHVIFLDDFSFKNYNIAYPFIFILIFILVNVKKFTSVIINY